MVKALRGDRGTQVQDSLGSRSLVGPCEGWFEAALALRSTNEAADALGELKTRKFNKSNSKFYMFE